METKEMMTMTEAEWLDPIVQEAAKHTMTWSDMKELLEWQDKHMKQATDEDPDESHTLEYWYGYGEALMMLAFNLFPKEFNHWFMGRLFSPEGATAKEE